MFTIPYKGGGWSGKGQKHPLQYEDGPLLTKWNSNHSNNDRIYLRTLQEHYT